MPAADIVLTNGLARRASEKIRKARSRPRRTQGPTLSRSGNQRAPVKNSQSNYLQAQKRCWTIAETPMAFVLVFLTGQQSIFCMSI